MARLLLVVVLTCGIFVMHTVGHPGDSPGTATSASAHAPSDHVTAYLVAPASIAVTDALHMHEQSNATSHDPATGMSVASLCVAVISVWLLVRLLRAMLTRRADWLTRLHAQTPVLLGPDPPPRKPDLTCLSVLRI